MTTTKIQIPCDECGGTITTHDSCECGTTLQELLEDEANDREIGREGRTR